MKLYIDINSGKLLRGVTGLPAPAPRFYLYDKFNVDVVLVDSGVAVTDTYLSAGRSLQFAIRGFPLIVAPLVTASVSTSTAQVATVPIDLTASALVTYFDTFVPASLTDTRLAMEIQIADDAGDYRQTFFQGRVQVARELNVSPVVVAGPDFTPTDFSPSDFQTT